MSGVRITFTSNWDDVFKELDRLETLPDGGANERLEKVLLDFLATAKAQTHVITGSLKNSGRAEIDLSQESVWSGEIIFGGPSPGAVHDPVDYAIYEYSRSGSKDGTPHNFLSSAYLYNDSFQEAILESLAGEE